VGGLASNCGRIALVDELQTAPADVELYRVPDVKMNVYFRRWLHLAAPA
jgi:hypothetical protein